MNYVIGIDLGTSAVKILLIDREGQVCKEIKKSYPLIQEKSGYSEQEPEQWIIQTTNGLKELVNSFDGNINSIEGISFAGQMDGLVLLDKDNNVLRNAILWNDTRSSKQCRKIEEVVGKSRLLEITKNMPMEGLTLPQLLWVQDNEPEVFEKTNVFLLPKDYLRYRIVGSINSEYSDAAATLMLEIGKKKWSEEILQQFNIKLEICPSLVESNECVGTISSDFAQSTGLSESTKVFAGGADNACGAIGAGILSIGKTLCSIGTSGVVVSYEETPDRDFQGKVNYFNHAKENAYFSMGAALSAGYSLSWFKDTFAQNEDFDSLLEGLADVPIGANGLIFTPYLVGERTPHIDAVIRGSFIGLDATNKKIDFVRAVIEGVTFALNESIEIFRDNGITVDTIISIGGGAKNELWLQMQADIFNAKVVKLASEQGPGMGAAMLAAHGCGWFSSLEECAEKFIKSDKIYKPIKENVEKYKELYKVYKMVYSQTKCINEQLKSFRK
ncbi:xylulokinase [Alkalihalobacillus sp. BA299]|uniref:xylulokinase n=1 Tax=Alkalihalobacillus sp. BA299 TaxID=2815938 RepID=UPI001ADB6D2A|nr:xylulokinase [Alkalihalobacillus sp. BA299]